MKRNVRTGYNINSKGTERNRVILRNESNYGGMKYV